MDDYGDPLFFDLPQATQSANILVVEDDQAMSVLLQELMRSEGYEVHSTANGDEAVALVQAGVPSGSTHYQCIIFAHNNIL